MEPMFMSDDQRARIAEALEKVESVCSEMEWEHEEAVGLRTAADVMRNMILMKERWVDNGGSF